MARPIRKPGDLIWLLDEATRLRLCAAGPTEAIIVIGRLIRVLVRIDRLLRGTFSIRADHSTPSDALAPFHNSLP